RKPDLAGVRRMEAVSFRSFPSTVIHYDGTWAIRLTAGHPAKRLNSVNPLDPRDNTNLEKRLELAKRRFEGYGRELVFRQTPLAPKQLDTLFDSLGWESFDQSLVMAASIGEMDLAGAVDRLPLADTGRWVDCFLKLSGEPAEQKPGMVEVISVTRPKVGLFIEETQSGEILGSVRCVVDGDLAGLFEIEANRNFRRKGHATRLVLSALKWAVSQGARISWLQVVAENNAAIGLYGKLGFQQIYTYSYRRQAR
ncbi:MAG: GNAT family N-acetyltransferase, partial [Rhizobiaceae bacterium]